MVDTNIVGCNWIELPASCYSIRNNARQASRENPHPTSHCQIEVDVAVDKLISHPPEGTLVKKFVLILPQLQLIFQINVLSP